MNRFLLICAMLGISPAAQAALVSYNAPVTQASFDPSGHATILLPEFDATYGNLLSVHISFSGMSEPEFEVINLGNVAGTAVGQSMVTYTMTGHSIFIQGVASTGEETVSVGPNFLETAMSGSRWLSIDANETLPAAPQWIGTGNLTFDLAESFSTSGTTITPGATLAYGGNAVTQLNAVVQYDYTPSAVPEPMSVALLGAGIAGIAATRRRKASL